MGNYYIAYCTYSAASMCIYAKNLYEEYLKAKVTEIVYLSESTRWGKRPVIRGLYIVVLKGFDWAIRFPCCTKNIELIELRKHQTAKQSLRYSYLKSQVTRYTQFAYPPFNFGLKFCTDIRTKLLTCVPM